MEKQTFIIDIDGTICNPALREDGSADYENATPIGLVINRINELHAAGHSIILHTSRGMRTWSGDLKKIKQHVLPVLEAWLKTAGVNYHSIVCGKPWGENPIYVDNRNLSVKSFAIENPDFFESIVRAESNV